MEIREMTIDDYEQVYALWMRIKGFAIRSLDDSYDGIARFLKRNPATSVVAIEDSKTVGAILCGHDGRRGCLYHVCVDPDYRRRGIGKAMVSYCLDALRKEEINNVTLLAFTQNDIGNSFWHHVGWLEREDINNYDFNLNEQNTITYNKQKEEEKDEDN